MRSEEGRRLWRADINDLAGYVICASMLTVAGTSVSAASLKDPVFFESIGGRLNLIMTAVEAPVYFGNTKTMGWVYDVCRRASGSATSCLPRTSTRPYGGVWLKLKPNDTLRIRLVNKLPPVPDAKHCNPDLANNPTNLHTHGLIVEPHRSTGGSDPYGDYVFVEIQNPQNHSSCVTPAASARTNAPRAPLPVHDHAPSGVHPDMDVATTGAVEYAIHLVNHPSGLFWFHPHMHGVALNQVTSGMSGVITVGEPMDDCADDDDCIGAIKAGTTHLLVLKDSEVLANGTLKNQQESTFCSPNAAPGEAPRRGVCAGDGGGQWFHTINGQVFPDIAVNGHGSIWRIVNSAGSRSYDLSLAPEGGGDAIPLQVLSIDGITIDSNQVANLTALQAQLGHKMEVFRCPDAPGARHGDAVCTRHVRMMPSSRASVRVFNNRASARKAVLRTDVYDTAGDQWPAVDLALVSLAAPARGVATDLHIASRIKSLLSASGALGDVAKVVQPGGARTIPLEQAQRSTTLAETIAPLPGMKMAPTFAIDPALKLGLREDPDCANLAPHEHRRIYLGNPTPGSDDFGIGTSVITADNMEKNLTMLNEFNPTETKVCLTASRVKGKPTTEIWEIVNLTNEDHNFHIHQTRFSLLSNGPSQPNRIDDIVVLQDSVPVPHAADASPCDGSLAHYANGDCKPQSVWVSIPFTQIGDFVFHCHILEHEDGGMMARIRVVAPPARDTQ
jgi:L-ascorbate oxidase